MGSIIFSTTGTKTKRSTFSETPCTIGRKRQIIIHGVENDWEKKRHQCENCEKSYASKVALKYHETQVHNKKLVTYSCDICIKKFLSDKKLKSHIESIHQNKHENKCELCDRKFKRKDMLTSHYREVHHEANVNHHYSLNSSSAGNVIYPYACDVCGDRFKRKAHEKRHTILVHNIPKYKRLCEASNSNTTKESEHMKMNKNEDEHVMSVSTDNIIIKDERILPKKIVPDQNDIDKTLCQACNKRFSAVKNLNRHIMEHHGAKTNVCDSCELSFVRKDHLIRHNNSVHKRTSSAKVECENCKKQFGRRDNMLKHMKYCYEKNEK